MPKCWRCGGGKTITITTTGRPIVLMLQPAAGTLAQLNLTSLGGTLLWQLSLLRAGTSIATNFAMAHLKPGNRPLAMKKTPKRSRFGVSCKPGGSVWLEDRRQGPRTGLEQTPIELTRVELLGPK